MIWKKQNGTEILEVIGEGLTSRVYKAIRKHNVLNVQQIVALKVLHSKDAIQSLKNEIELLLTVDSPYCVKLLGWEETPKGLALVLEYLDGVSLDDLCRYRGLNVQEIDEILYQIQEGLRALHQKGIAHGDLGPKNIFVTNTGQIKIIDFGFSSREQKYCDYGTPNCVALEVWQGHPLSIWSDLYSLGLLRETLVEKSFENYEWSYWKERAFQVADKNSLLMTCPTKREFLNLKSTPAYREVIGGYVREIQLVRAHLQPTVKLSKRPSLRRINTKTWAATALAVLASATVSAAEPWVGGEAADKYYSIDVRSRKWASAQLFKINHGKKMLYQQGYAPVKFQSLPEGQYILEWLSQRRAGVVDIHLKDNKRIIIRK